MTTIYETAGRPHIFRLTDGSYARLPARGSISIKDDSNISNEILEAEKRKAIYMKKIPTKVSESISKKEV